MQFQAPPVDLTVLAQPLLVMVWAMLVLFIDLFTSDRRVLATVSLAGLAASAVAGALTWNYVPGQPPFFNMVVLDHFGTIVNWILVGVTALTIMISLDYMPRQGMVRGEFYALLLFATSGMMLLVQANDLVMIFIGVELLSIALYVLTGFGVPNVKSGEAAMKYLLLGAFAAGFLVYGIALIYGFTGKTSLPEIGAELNRLQAGGAELRDPLLLAGLGLVSIALGFKVAMVPFHAWTPDVYEGAPTPVAGYMSVATKGAAFVALFRVLSVGFPALQADWQIIFGILAALTMALGNIAAVAQTSIKRMLAYSSIAHAGYILLSVLAGTAQGQSSFLVYFLSYALTNLGAFAVLIALEKRGLTSFELNDLRGLARRHPLLAGAMMVFMFSLAGVPPTAGFFGKFAVFQAALAANLDWLAIVGVLTSVVSAFFYLRVIVLMFMRDESTEWDERPVFATSPLVAGVVIAALGVIGLGLAMAPLLEAVSSSVIAAR